MRADSSSLSCSVSFTAAARSLSLPSASSRYLVCGQREREGGRMEGRGRGKGGRKGGREGRRVGGRKGGNEGRGRRWRKSEGRREDGLL